MTDHELLIQLTQQVNNLQLLLTNHVYHHLVYTVALMGGCISTVTAFVLYWLGHRKPAAAPQRQ